MPVDGVVGSSSLSGSRASAAAGRLFTNVPQSPGALCGRISRKPACSPWFHSHCCGQGCPHAYTRSHSHTQRQGQRQRERHTHTCLAGYPAVIDLDAHPPTLLNLIMGLSADPWSRRTTCQLRRRVLRLSPLPKRADWSESARAGDAQSSGTLGDLITNSSVSTSGSDQEAVATYVQSFVTSQVTMHACPPARPSDPRSPSWRPEPRSDMPSSALKMLRTGNVSSLPASLGLSPSP